MNASAAASACTTLYSDCLAAGSVVVSAVCVSFTTVGLSYSVKNDLAPDFGSTAKVASSSGSGMSIVHSVSTMSYLSVCSSLLVVFGSSSVMVSLMPSDLSSACRIVAIVM